ncbi:DUF6434 domain-containing protein [Metabacillus litoralis]|uniref:DUF6434 domain-containing protein n=1 Tax=Metabacillus litoralis TaxID=152268 RepID=UPI001CFCE927|nr:DUF6434 domain-containing protein [Metabacillus litoralis]
MRPLLSSKMTITEFQNYYWLKKELHHFCKENALATSGSKLELTKRIELFLLTGNKEIPIKKKKSPQKKQLEELGLDTVISSNVTFSQNVRFFFKSVIPNFHFSTYIQNYMKENVGKTYRDVVHAWYEEEKRKKDPNYKREIAPQFEYNQFTRDFFNDPANKGKSREDAINAWNTIKSLPGENKYCR